ncbi:MAG: hypothetical protein Sylvanvirus34_7 [Sylvanvirus sp.]|uniref:Uncharacterized protein n=1 Tax=Sylvanvirus sp. TaxID=2487774 RepID=A0A3G5AJ71_9VIRU|nr:MAG: hypothetical protein Sylvanvirus34_7 [Sylvanvirus sp.]
MFRKKDKTVKKGFEHYNAEPNSPARRTLSNIDKRQCSEVWEL